MSTTLLPRRKVFGPDGRTGKSESTGKREIKDGLFVPPIAVGPRRVAWIEGEVEQLLQARVRGKCEAEIRELVRELVAARAGAS